jgi:hypothetical protein
MQADGAARHHYGILEFKIDTRDRQFIATAILLDGGEWPPIDATEMFEKFLREEGGGVPVPAC